MKNIVINDLPIRIGYWEDGVFFEEVPINIKFLIKILYSAYLSLCTDNNITVDISHLKLNDPDLPLGFCFSFTETDYREFINKMIEY